MMSRSSDREFDRVPSSCAPSVARSGLPPSFVLSAAAWTLRLSRSRWSTLAGHLQPLTTEALGKGLRVFRLGEAAHHEGAITRRREYVSGLADKAGAQGVRRATSSPGAARQLARSIQLGTAVAPSLPSRYSACVGRRTHRSIVRPFIHIDRTFVARSAGRSRTNPGHPAGACCRESWDGAHGQAGVGRLIRCLEKNETNRVCGSFRLSHLTRCPSPA
jgi:hypothetical protein